MAGSVPPFKRLLRGYTVNQLTGCWVWSGHTYKNGYGVRKAFGKDVSAHRFSYELHKGSIPHGMMVLHSCDNKRCINPDHLRVGSHSENMAEASSRGRMRSGTRHPMYGRSNPRPLQANRVRVLGVEYSSQKEAERSLGLGSGTVRYWLQNKPSKAQIISKGAANVSQSL